MVKGRAKYFWIAVGSIAALLIVSLIAIVVWRATASHSVSGQLISDEALDLELKKPDVIVGGTVGDPQRGAIRDATVTLSLHNGDGQMVWRLTRPVNRDGSFTIQSRDLPTIPNLYAGVIAAEAPNYLAEKTNVSVEIVGPALLSASPSPSPPSTESPHNQLRKTQITPQRVHLKLVPYSPWLALVVLIPAIFGLIFAILHLTQFARGMWVTYWYALGIASLWGLIVVALVYLYVKGEGLIPLFWPDLFVSSGIIIFSFIGSIIYVAYSINEKTRGFFDVDETARKRILLSLGGRILVAPYVALTAYGIFAATFPSLRTGPFAAFFGFFTGLWIKPVLEALNDIGMRLLSAEEQEKVKAQLTRAENPDAPPPQTSSALALRPEQAFLGAVAVAREELLKKNGVIGVAAGFKVSAEAGKTGERAIVAFVYEKNEPSNSADRVPETFMGYPTDVIPLPAADQNEDCRDVAFCMSWEKLHQDHEQQLSQEAPLPHDAPVEKFGQVLVLTDRTAFFKLKSGQQEFDVKRAYQSIRSTIGDIVEFVSFIIDPKMGSDFYQSNFSVPVFNNVSGINHFKGSSYSVRAEWGTSKLLACQVISPLPLPLSFRTFIHEVAHSWSAYVTFNNPEAPETNPNYDLLVGKQFGDPRYHWNRNFINGRSCMGKERFEWITNPDGTFTRRPVADKDFTYCALDLYLMGLIPAAQVPSLRVLEDSSQVSGTPTFQASIKAINISQIVASCGKRVPAASPNYFKQALVVVSDTPANGLVLAKEVEEHFRKEYEKLFARATRHLATISTSII